MVTTIFPESAPLFRLFQTHCFTLALAAVPGDPVSPRSPFAPSRPFRPLLPGTPCTPWGPLTQQHCIKRQKQMMLVNKKAGKNGCNILTLPKMIFFVYLVFLPHRKYIFQEENYSVPKKSQINVLVHGASKFLHEFLRLIFLHQEYFSYIKGKNYCIS